MPALAAWPSRRPRQQLMTQMLSMPGSVLTLEVDGPDARDCLDALVALFAAPPPNGNGTEGPRPQNV